MTRNRNASIASIVRRRSHLRTAFVASGPPSAAGSSRSVRIPPTAVGDPVSFSARAMNAIVPIQSPSADTPWPMSRSRNPRRLTRVEMLTAASRSKKRRWAYTPSPGVAGRRLPTTRFTSIGAAMAPPATAPLVPFVTARTGCERDLGDEGAEAGLAGEAGDDEQDEEEDRAGPGVDEQRAQRGRDAPPAVAAQERRPVVAGDGEATGDPRRGWGGAAPAAGPTAPLATSQLPATARAAKPVTWYSDVPDTVPVPVSRRSTPALQRAMRFENGIEPAANETRHTPAASIGSFWPAGARRLGPHGGPRGRGRRPGRRSGEADRGQRMAVEAGGVLVGEGPQFLDRQVTPEALDDGLGVRARCRRRGDSRPRP